MLELAQALPAKPVRDVGRGQRPSREEDLAVKAPGRGDLGERGAQLGAVDHPALVQDVTQVDDRLARPHAGDEPFLDDDPDPLLGRALELERAGELPLERVDEEVRERLVRELPGSGRNRRFLGRADSHGDGGRAELPLSVP